MMEREEATYQYLEEAHGNGMFFSPVIGVYENCELLDWWITFNNRRVVMHIDDSEVFRKLEREGCL